MAKRTPFQPDPAAVARYVDNPASIAWEHRCYLDVALGGPTANLRDARGRAAYIGETARVLGYPSTKDAAAQIAAVVVLLEAQS